MEKTVKLLLCGFLMFLIIFSGCLSQTADGGGTPPTTAPAPDLTSPPATASITPSPTQKPASTEAPVKETSLVTIKVRDTAGNPLNGMALFEKGWVHSNRFAYGGLVVDGELKITLPKVRDIPKSDWNYWGLHVYATDHIYFPQAILVEPGNNSAVFEVSLAPDPNPADDPVISDIAFEKSGGDTIIKMTVSSPKNMLGPQNLAFNSKTGEAFVMEPPSAVAELSDNFPNGVYTLRYPGDVDPADWYFVSADHGCSNGPVQGYPVDQNIISAGAGAPSTTVAPSGSVSEIGAELVFAQGCTNCHFFDKISRFEEKDARTNWRIGPGLKGLFTKPELPATGRPAVEDNVRKQIREGGNGMPPYPNLTEEEVSNIIAYLKSI